jgi:Ca-activated chloride channel family protein
MSLCRIRTAGPAQPLLKWKWSPGRCVRPSLPECARVVSLPEFARPWLLLLLLAVPPLVWYWLRRGRGALRYPSAAILEELPAGRSILARRTGAAFRGLALSLIIIALAGPRWPDTGSRIPTEGIAINLVLDVSGSMAERDFAWKDPATGRKEQISRLEAVKRAFRLFVAGGDGPGGEHLAGRDNDLLGLVTFATRPETACPLTLSHSVLLKILDEQQPRSIPEEARTNIGDGLAWGLYRLGSAGSRRKVLVLLTDGEHNIPPPALKPRQAAQLAGNLGVPVYVIDAGPDAPGKNVENSSAVDRLNARKSLQEVARISKGRYFSAQDFQGLVEVCSQIDELERQPIESFQYQRYHEAYAWPGLAALALLTTVIGLEMTCWRRMP